MSGKRKSSGPILHSDLDSVYVLASEGSRLAALGGSDEHLDPPIKTRSPGRAQSGPGGGDWV